MRILVSKYGATFRTREDCRRGSPSGEVGETEGLIRYLISQGHDVAYFGQMRGEIEGCTYIPSCLRTIDDDPLDHESTWEDQQAAWAIDHMNVLQWGEPDMYITVAGYSVTMSFIENPNFTTVQAASVRYCGPVLGMYRSLGLPRIVVNNDPRTYPKDQEMSLIDPGLRPAALLDQYVGPAKTQVVGGTKYKRHSCYACPESWAYLDEYHNTGEYPCVILAHSHVHDGIKQRGRMIAWENVIDRPWPIYGKGWEWLESDAWNGHVNPREVIDILASHATCPMVAHEHFYTGKPYMLNSCDCIPILYGDGDPYTADPLGKWEPMDSPHRIRKPGDLSTVVERVTSDLAYWREVWDERLKPDYTKLDELITYVDEGGILPNFERFGGYEQLS